MGEAIRHLVARDGGDRWIGIGIAFLSAAVVAIAALGSVQSGPYWGLTLRQSGSAVIVAAVQGSGLVSNFAAIEPGQRVIEIDGGDPRSYLGSDLTGVQRFTIEGVSGQQIVAEAPTIPPATLPALLIGALFFVGLGAIVCRWAADTLLGGIFLTFGWAVAITLVAIPAGTLGRPWGNVLAGATAVIAASSFLLLFLEFPHPLPRLRWIFPLIAVITLALIIAITAFASANAPFPRVFNSLLWLWVACGFVGGLVLLGLRTRDPEDRPRVAPIIVGTVVGIAPLVLFSALPGIIAHELILPAGLAALGLVSIPIGFTYAILRHRLFALDALLRQVVLRCADVAIYVAIFDLLWAPLRRLGVAELGAGTIAIVLAALVVPGLSRLLQDLIDRSLYGSVFEARRNSPFAEQQSVRELGIMLTHRVRQLVPVQWVALVASGSAPIGPSFVDPARSTLIAIDGDAPLEPGERRWSARYRTVPGPECDGTVVRIGGGAGSEHALIVGRRLNGAPLNSLDLETMRLLAWQAAAPLEAAVLREQAEDERRFRDGLSIFARRLAEAGSVEQVLQVTVDQSCQLLRADAGFAWLRDPSGDLTLAATSEDDVARFAAAAEIVRWSACDDPAAPPTSPRMVERPASRPGYAREIGSRIVYRLGDGASKVAIGVVIRKAADHPFSQEDERRTEEIVDHANGAFRRAFALAQAAEAETLRQITRVRSEFLDVVSHDLQNPLTAIRGFTELLEAHLHARDDAYVDTALASITEATTACQHLIDDLLTSSRIERGQLTLNRKPIDVGAFLSRVARSYQIMPEGYRVCVGETGALWVSADAARLEQMVGNLVTNALRYAESGPVTLSARRLSSWEGAIEVRDQGKGIAPEDQPKIWDRFYRTASGQLRTTSGTGVGLSVVRTLAELHGGRAEVESALGEGSTFRIILPVAEEPSPRGDASPTPRSPRESAIRSP